MRCRAVNTGSSKPWNLRASVSRVSNDTQSLLRMLPMAVGGKEGKQKKSEAHLLIKQHWMAGGLGNI